MAEFGFDGGAASRKRPKRTISADLKEAYAKSDPNKFVCIFVLCVLIPPIIGGIGVAFLHRNDLLLPITREFRVRLGVVQPPTFPEVETMWGLLNSIHRSHQFQHADGRFSAEFGRNIFELASTKHASTVCKFGIDTGHYATALASATRTTHIWVFEVGKGVKDDHDLPLEILQLEEKFLKNHWRDRFHLLRQWDSKEAIPKYVKQNRGRKCDMVLIGGHRRVGEFEMDVKEARQIADIDSTVVSINFEGDAKEDGTGCNDAACVIPAYSVWKSAVEAGQVIQHGCMFETYNKSEIQRFRDPRDRAKNHDLPIVIHSKKVTSHGW